MIFAIVFSKHLFSNERNCKINNIFGQTNSANVALLEDCIARKFFLHCYELVFIHVIYLFLTLLLGYYIFALVLLMIVWKGAKFTSDQFKLCNWLYWYVVFLLTVQTNKLQVNVENGDANPKSIEEELEESLEDSETKLKSLTIQETEGWQVLVLTSIDYSLDLLCF